MSEAALPSAEAPYARYLGYLKDGKLAYQYSLQARKVVFYPRVRCPFTGEDCLEWRISAGRGTVYSTSVVHPQKGDAYNVALIDMDEGFRLMSKVVEIDPYAVKVGQRVVFHSATEEGPEDPIPVFKLMGREQ